METIKPNSTYIVPSNGLYRIGNSPGSIPLRAGDKVRVCKCGEHYVNKFMEVKLCNGCQKLKEKLGDICDN